MQHLLRISPIEKGSNTQVYQNSGRAMGALVKSKVAMRARTTVEARLAGMATHHEGLSPSPEGLRDCHLGAPQQVAGWIVGAIVCRYLLLNGGGTYSEPTQRKQGSPRGEAFDPG